VWKRDSNRITAPYDSSDQVDFFVINVVHNNKVGQFVFPKAVLLEKGVFSTNSKGGKRGIRVYSPWCEANNRQAAKTKQWQERFFIDLSLQDSENIERFRNLYLTCL
jgi:hypothetical protein